MKTSGSETFIVASPGGEPATRILAREWQSKLLASLI